jgi:hypothetical protein
VFGASSSHYDPGLIGSTIVGALTADSGRNVRRPRRHFRIHTRGYRPRFERIALPGSSPVVWAETRIALCCRSPSRVPESTPPRMTATSIFSQDTRKRTDYDHKGQAQHPPRSRQAYIVPSLNWLPRGCRTFGVAKQFFGATTQ